LSALLLESDKRDEVTVQEDGREMMSLLNGSNSKGGVALELGGSAEKKN
jgi:hypothetical protein